MIPVHNIEIDDEEFEEEIEPSYTYAINEDRISGYIDEKEAIKQAIYLIINTERFEYIIYSWDYGIELQDLIGESISYVKSEVKRRITEALICDDRIYSIDDFIFEQLSKRILLVKFTANTIYGSVDIETEVSF